MELTNEISKTEKSESNLNHKSKHVSNSNPKLTSKTDGQQSFTNNKVLKVKSKMNIKDNMNKKKVKFKTANFVEIIKIESFKKYNVIEICDESIKSFSRCDCNIL